MAMMGVLVNSLEVGMGNGVDFKKMAIELRGQLVDQESVSADLLDALEYVADIDVLGADDRVIRFILAAAQHKARAAISRAKGEK